MAGSVPRFFSRIVPSSELLSSLAKWCRRAGFAALAAGALVGSWEIRKWVGEDPCYYLDDWGIEAVGLPGWVTPEIRSEIESVELGAGERLHLFDPGVFRKIRRSLESCPWIAEVTDIRLRPRSELKRPAVELALRLRSPVALVEHGGLYYLADAEGVRLGAPYRAAPIGWFRVPAIVSIPAPGPVPEEGASWVSRDVLQGIAVAKALFDAGLTRDFHGSLVERIDLDNLHGRRDPRRPEIVLWAGGRRYDWGRSPISSGPRAVPVEAAVAALRRCLSDPAALEGIREVRLDAPGAPIGSRG